MTVKEQLIHEIEQASETLTEEIFYYFLFTQFRQKQLQKTRDLSVQNLEGKSIWQLADEFAKDIPAQEWERLPTDGAEQHDHYIYGMPKHEV
jgi:hypothetical protein